MISITIEPVEGVILHRTIFSCKTGSPEDVIVRAWRLAAMATQKDVRHSSRIKEAIFTYGIERTLALFYTCSY